MDCGECNDEGELMAIEYTDGTTEEVPLCETCRERFADGDLVSEISRVEREESAPER